MKIGIKYCGGCNSRYDRTKELKKIMDRFPQHTYTYATRGATICDIWLVLCGCPTGCASIDGLTAKKKLFMLHTPREFDTVVAFLQQQGTAKPEQSLRYLHIGDTASLSRTFTETDIQSFARLTGDYGKLHTDADFAATYGFGRPVVHGVLTGSLLSSVMGMELPGDGTIFMDESLYFRAPVFPGDTITATITLEAVTEQKRFYTGTLTGTCTNQSGIIVAEGTFHQMLMKNLFCVEKGTGD